MDNIYPDLVFIIYTYNNNNNNLSRTNAHALMQIHKDLHTYTHFFLRIYVSRIHVEHDIIKFKLLNEHMQIQPYLTYTVIGNEYARVHSEKLFLLVHPRLFIVRHADWIEHLCTHEQDDEK